MTDFHREALAILLEGSNTAEFALAVATLAKITAKGASMNDAMAHVHNLGTSAPSTPSPPTSGRLRYYDIVV
jgi:hypothetical protein